MISIKTSITLTALIVLFALSFGVRQSVYHAQEEVYGRDMPFTLESALHFRLIRHLLETGSLPRHDPRIQYPDGLDVAETYTLGQEYVYAAGARLLPDSLTLESKVRILQTAWFSLGVVMLACWIGVRCRSRIAGLLGGLFYAVMIAAVLRSTGQEISRENFALPLLFAHGWMFSLALQREGRQRIILMVLSAVFLSLSLCTWDMIQVYIYIWLAGMLWTWLRYGRRNTAVAMLIYGGALLLTGLLNPYHRAHGWWMSPAVLVLVFSVFLLLLPSRLKATGSSRAIAVCSLVVSGLLGSFVGTQLLQHSYGHFSELLWAKIHFMNVKPADPALLTFNQRILWTPALNSADWVLTVNILPFSLLLFVLSLALHLVGLIRKSCTCLDGGILLCWALFFIAFVLFVRFHVYLAVVSAMLVGWYTAWTLRRHWLWQLVLFSVLAGGLVLEAGNTLKMPERWGRPNVYYEELQSLTAFLDEEVAPQPVLANFGVSGPILTYGRCPIVLHPKFERALIRQRVEAYGEALFKGDEITFRSFCDRVKAQYYVYGKGEFARIMPELQMRYFVDALEPPDDAVARQFEFAPSTLRYFRLVWENRKYAVYDIITSFEEASAVRLADSARTALEQGRIHEAYSLSVKSLGFDPVNTNAAAVLLDADGLLEAGFGR